MPQRKRVRIPTEVRQRGSGKEIPRVQAIVFDFMPPLLGNEFRVDPTLSMQLFRDDPVGGPMRLMDDAYTRLGQHYTDKGALTPALKCYKFALHHRTGFVSFISSVQDAALLTQDEIAHLDLNSPLEEALIRAVYKKRPEVDQDLYHAWLDHLRASHAHYLQLNRKEYGSRQYLESLLVIGNHEQAMYFAKESGDRGLVQRVRLARPKEILDVKWLRRYADEHHPDSTIGR
ncbi:MAG: hypothetical protein ABIH41_01305 [Nanoarchaeota archaeon]